MTDAPTYPFPDTPTNPLNGSSHPDVTNPVLTANDVTDADPADVADPQLFVDADGTWHMFFEIFNGSLSYGKIAHATSSDGVSWSYDQEIIDAGYHLALPHVFQKDGDHWMIPHVEDPDGDGNEELELWRATSFPTNWTKEMTLWEAPEINDSVHLEWGGRTWIFYGAKGGGGSENHMHAVYADSLTGSYFEHSQNPLIEPYGRPCGMPIVRDDHIVHFGMEQPTAVHGYIIDQLGPDTFSHRMWGACDSADTGWKSDRFHTWCAWPQQYRANQGSGWTIAVDGSDGAEYSIGIYESIPEYVQRRPTTVSSPF